MFDPSPLWFSEPRISLFRQTPWIWARGQREASVIERQEKRLCAYEAQIFPVRPSEMLAQGLSEYFCNVIQLLVGVVKMRTKPKELFAGTIMPQRRSHSVRLQLRK